MKRRLPRLAAVLVVPAMVAPLLGCSQSAGTTDDLEHVLVETHSALATAQLTAESLRGHQLTIAAAQTSLEDMAAQASDAAHALESVSIGSAADQRDRDAVAAAVTDGEQALLTARDDLAANGSADPAPLVAADDQVSQTLDRLRATR